MANNKHSKKQILSFLELQILVVLLGIGLAVALPHYMHKVKQADMEVNFNATPDIQSEQPKSLRYHKFWKDYNIIMVERGYATDGYITSKNSEEFKEEFEKKYKIHILDDGRIVNSEGYPANGRALECLIDGFYPDKPWVYPACPIP